MSKLSPCSQQYLRNTPSQPTPSGTSTTIQTCETLRILRSSRFSQCQVDRPVRLISQLVVWSIMVGMLTPFGVGVHQMALANDEPPLLISAPEFTRGSTTFPPVGSTPEARGGLTVSLSSREEALAFYNAVYLPSNDVDSGWSGSVADCSAGTTSAAWQLAMVRRINYFRAMAGVPADVTLNEEYNLKAQSAALMMSANRKLNHYPSNDWQCFSGSGNDGAGNSNLYLHRNSTTAIDGYIRDPGDSNKEVRHRSWILYPRTMAMGVGDIPKSDSHPSANALWVLDSAPSQRPATRDSFISWPPPGYVPYTVIYPRWSFSYPDADFREASVTVAQGGEAAPLRRAAGIKDGDFSVLVWDMLAPETGEPWSAPTEEAEYTVNISGVKIDGAERSFVYMVKSFNPSLHPEGTNESGETDQIISLNHAAGASGSFFNIVGNGYTEGHTVTVELADRAGPAATTVVDEAGRFAIIVDSAGAENGTNAMTIRVTNGVTNGLARAADATLVSQATPDGSTAVTTYFTIAPSSPLRTREATSNGAEPVEIKLVQPASEAQPFPDNGEPLYLPLVQN